MIDTSENKNCNKKLTQDDAGSSQNKSYNKHKTCAENMVKGLRAIPKHPNINKRKTLDVQSDSQKSPHETINKAKTGKTKCQSLCLCSYEDIWDSEKKNHEVKSV